MRSKQSSQGSDKGMAKRQCLLGTSTKTEVKGRCNNFDLRLFIIITRELVII